MTVVIRLKKQADRKVRRGYLWIFSNEIDYPAVKDLSSGGIYDVMDSSGEFLGVAYANPKSLIAARLLSRKKVSIDVDFVLDRLKTAFERRQAYCRNREAYRIFFGEADLLPGLVLDLYGRHVALQSSTAGVDTILDTILEAIESLISPESIVVRNDSSIRILEGVPIFKEVKLGSSVDGIKFKSKDISFVADLINGQKTGFFLDQEFNRPLLNRYVPEQRVGSRSLLLFRSLGYPCSCRRGHFSHCGGFLCSSHSTRFPNRLHEPLRITDQCCPLRCLQFLKSGSEKWDVIILDPPAFIKSRSKIREGRQGYIDVNKRAIERLKPGGLFVTCSCSGHMGLPDFLEVINIAAYRNGRDLRVLDVLGQGPDHPTLTAMPETRYLKVIIAQAL